MAIKADQKYTKDEILEFYLNTIYFGRGAYGIQAASKAYYGGPVEKLTPEQGAVLAGVIKDPTNLDPKNNLEGAKRRWNYVLGGMAEEGWYDKAKMQTAQYPMPKPPVLRNFKKGANGLLARAVEREVAEKLNLQSVDEAADLLNFAGYKVYTTVDLRMQDMAVQEAAVAVVKEDTSDVMDSALVSIQPGTGRVLAYYGGKGNYGDADLADRRHPHFPGSSMKPYVLAGAIDKDISINSVWDGSSPQKFKDRQTPLKNAGNDNSCRQCNLVDSTVKSLNTVYWALAREVGPGEVKKVAARAGITRITSVTDGATHPIDEAKVDARIGIGALEIPVIDQAAGYATFANKGKYVPPYFVEKILKADGSVLYQRQAPAPRQAFSEDAARDTGFAMQGVARKSARLAGGRPAAGKTGTHDYRNTADNSNVWMCGYTPQIATAVWVGSRKGENPLRLKSGGRISSLFTAKIWKKYMDKVLDGVPEEGLPEPAFKGDESKGNVEIIRPPTERPEEPGFPTIPTQGPRETEGPGQPTAPPTEDPTDPLPTGEPTDPLPTRTKQPGFPR